MRNGVASFIEDWLSSFTYPSPMTWTQARPPTVFPKLLDLNTRLSVRFDLTNVSFLFPTVYRIKFTGALDYPLPHNPVHCEYCSICFVA